MKLTDSESGIIFNINADIIGAVFNRGPHRIIKTRSDEFFRSRADIHGKRTGSGDLGSNTQRTGG